MNTLYTQKPVVSRYPARGTKSVRGSKLLTWHYIRLEITSFDIRWRNIQFLEVFEVQCIVELEIEALPAVLCTIPI